MPGSYTLELQIFGVYTTDIPQFEIWEDGVLDSTHNALSTGSTISVTINYGGALPASLEFRFNDALPEGGRTIEIRSVIINDQYVNTGNYLSSDSLINGGSATVDAVTPDFLFDPADPTGADFGGATALTAGNDYYNRAFDSSNQVVDALAGNDGIVMGSGNDRVNGGAGDDRILGGTGDDFLFGGDDNDTIFGNADNDEIYGGNGNDRLLGGSGDDEIHGGANDDIIRGGSGNDTLTGGTGADHLGGGGGNDIMYGGAGQDFLSGSSGDDTLDGGGDNDTLLGGGGADFVDGGDGDDILAGHQGADTLNGGDGDDQLFGGADNDTLIGGEDIGSDYLHGGAGDDTLDGGAGSDVLVGDGYYDADLLSVYRFENNTRDSLRNATDATLENGATLSSTGGHDSRGGVELSGGANERINLGTTNIGGALTFSLWGRFDNLGNSWARLFDLGQGQSNDNILFAKQAATSNVAFELYIGGSSAGVVVANNAVIVGEWAHWTATADAAGNVAIYKNGEEIASGTFSAAIPTLSRPNSYLGDSNWAFDDELDGGIADFVIHETALTAAEVSNLYAHALTGFGDLVNGTGGVDTINGGADNDTIVGDIGDDTLNGEAGNDTINGGTGNDTINGGAGNDTITGGEGVDTIDAGTEDDLILLANGDFAAGESIDGGANNDELRLTSTTTVDFTTGTLANLETLTGSVGNDDVTYTIQQALAFTTIDLAGGTDSSRVNITGTVDVTALGTPTVNNTENGFLTGSGGNDDLTISGAQLDSLIFGSGTIDFDAGTDILRLTSTSADLNSLGGTDGSIAGLETIDATGAGAAVIIDLNGQTENFTINTSANGDTITGGSGIETVTGGVGIDTITANAGADVIDGAGGNDIINLANGDFAAGESIDGGADTDNLVLTNATTVDFTTGTLANLETLTGSTGNDDVTYSIQQALDFTTIDLEGGTDTTRINIAGTVDVTALGTPTVLNAENGFLTGSGGNDDLTITGSQLNAIVFGSGNIDFDAGTDVLRLTSTSTDLNALGATDGSILGLEEVNASTAGAAVTLDLNGQTEGFIVTGSGNADIITLGSGDDTISGGSGGDTINGGGGIDTIDGGLGADIINGDAGDDIITDFFGTNQLSGGTGNDNITGGSGTDTITGGADVDTINASGGNDIINLANGDFAAGESIDGGADTDNLILTNATTVDLTTGTLANLETFTGSTGNDNVTFGITQFFGFTTIDYDGGTDTQTISIAGVNDVTALGAPTVSNLETSNLIASAGVDDLTITGAQFDSLTTGLTSLDFLGGADVLRLTSTSTNLNTLGGTDGNLAGLETIDTTGAGASVTIDLNGQTENFTINASANGDTITGGSGIETVTGGAGIDTITANAGADVIDGAGGNDIINLANGDFAAGESIDGGADTDELILTNATTIDFSTGTLANLETLTGSTGDDDVTLTITQFFGFDDLDYGGGTDSQTVTVFGTHDVSALTTPTVTNLESASILFSAGADDLTITGAQLDAFTVGLTTLDTLGGADVLHITSTSAALNTYGSNDVNLVNLETITAASAGAGVTIDMRAQTEALSIIGSANDDTIIGGLGVDTLNGGAGNDTINSSFGDIADTIDGGAGTSDTLTYEDAAGGIVLDLANGAAQDTQGAGVDTVSNIENVTGSDFNDTLDGDANNNIIIGGTGDDEIEGHGGDDTLDGGGGAGDVVTYESAGSAVTVDLSNLGAQNTFGAGTDTLSNFENLIGSDFADDLTGDGNANVITGGDGADTIDGGGGNDTILGGDDNDILTGGAGDDTIYGATIIGQSGVETVIQTSSTQWHSVTFAASITNPVIKMSNMTNNDGDFYSVRVRSVTDSGFEWQIDEWDYLDGSRAVAEDISWIAIAEGTHTLDNGSVVQAGLTTATNENFTTVTFASAFASAPVVMSQVMTDNEASAVATRNRSRSTTGFQLQMQEQESNTNSHATETVGWIAIDNGGSVADGIIIGETGNTVTGNNSNVSFGGTFANIPVVVHDQQTRDGGDTSYSQANGVATSNFDVEVGEEQSNDGETNHTTEVIGFFALNEGLLSAQGGGDNTITGGAGVDTLFGGDGADTFIFELLNAFVDNDILADFSAGEGDILDISDLITSGTVNAGNVTNYLNFDDSSGTDTIVEVDSAGGGAHSAIATITGITGLDEVTLFTGGNIIA